MITIDDIRKTGMTPENARLLGFVLTRWVGVNFPVLSENLEFSQLCLDAIEAMQKAEG
jgi:hypothetical protein